MAENPIPHEKTTYNAQKMRLQNYSPWKIQIFQIPAKPPAKGVGKKIAIFGTSRS